MPTAPITLAGTTAPTSTTTPGSGSGGGSGNAPVGQDGLTRTQRATMGMTPKQQAIASIADEYDLDPKLVATIYDPSTLTEGNKYAAAGGSDPKTARSPIFLRNPGDRLPTDFEIRNQWAYDPKREPIIGDGGKTLDVNSSDVTNAVEFTQQGYIPPKNTPAYKALAEFFSSEGETLEQTLSRLEVTGTLGQDLQQYPTNLAPVQNKDLIPTSSSVVYNPPATKTVQLADGFTQTQYLDVGWDGKPAGYTVQADIATSPKNIVATKGPGIPDDPNFVPTKNPEYWVLPNGTKVKSVPGSSDVVGFNGETWQWQIKPYEIGDKTTWDMIARNPVTNEIDLSMISREAAQKAKEFGILPPEYDYLTKTAPLMADFSKTPTASPIGVTKTTTPIDTTKTTTPPPPVKTTTPPPAAPVFTGRPLAENAAPQAAPSPSGAAPTNRDVGEMPPGTPVSPGQDRPAPQVAPRTSPVGGLPGGAAGAVRPVVPNPISLPRMTAL